MVAPEFVGVIMEAACSHVFQAAAVSLLRRGVGSAAVENAVRIAGHCWVLAVSLLSAPLFVEPLRMLGFYARFTVFPFGVHITPLVLSWVVGWLSHSYAAPLSAFLTVA
jgi:hypothetical protein